MVQQHKNNANNIKAKKMTKSLQKSEKQKADK